MEFGVWYSACEEIWYVEFGVMFSACEEIWCMEFGVRKFGVCNFAVWFLAYGILLCLDNHQSLDNRRMTFIRICNN